MNPLSLFHRDIPVAFSLNAIAIFRGDWISGCVPNPLSLPTGDISVAFSVSARGVFFWHEIGGCVTSPPPMKIPVAYALNATTIPRGDRLGGFAPDPLSLSPTKIAVALSLDSVWIFF